MDDELSLDQRNWHRVADIPELIPEERTLDLSLEYNRERLERAIMREDERNAGDRREHEHGVAAQFQRRASDRRAVESSATLLHRNMSSAIANSLKPVREKNIGGYIVIFLLVGSIVGLSLTLSKRSPAPVINVACASIAAPQVDWSYCHKQGKDLRDANLASANLNHASLQHADLSRATLLAANMEYVNFSETIAYAANLQSARMTHAVMQAANFNSANLANADLSYAVLVNADLRGANLSGANLTHAVLNNANIEGADFSGAILDQTIWVNNAVCTSDSRGECLAMAASSIQPPVVTESKALSE